MRKLKQVKMDREECEIDDSERDRLTNLITDTVVKVLDFAEERMKAKGCSLQDLWDLDPVEAEDEGSEDILMYITRMAWDCADYIHEGTDLKDIPVDDTARDR